MKRGFRLVHSNLARVCGAIGVTALILGACSIAQDSGLENGCPPGTELTCTGTNAPDGGFTSSGASGTGVGGGDFGGAGGEGGGELDPPMFPDAGDEVLWADAGSVPPEEDAGGIKPPELPAACAVMDKNPRVMYMSADDSNSMGSPGHVRETINVGFEPNPSRIRTYEFLNYYQIAYDAAPYDQLALVPEIQVSPDSPIADFQLGVRSYDALPVRRPMNITFLVDTSGSMKGPGIERAKAAVEAIASKFVAGDIVSFLTTTSTVEKVGGHPITGPGDTTITDILKDLTIGGSSDLNTSLAKAYQLAGVYKDAQINMMSRVVLISDGGANVGITDTDIISERSADADKEGIYLVGIGTGPALSYNDKLMNDVTEAGRGAYVYLDSVDEATKMLANRFEETMDIAARAVQVELTLPWYFVVKSDSTEGPISTTAVEPQHLALKDAMVFLLQTTACDPSVYSLDDKVRVRVAWKTPYLYSSRVTELELPINAIAGMDKPRVAKGRAIVAFAEALKGCGFDAKGKTLCKDETERKSVTKMKLIEARKLAEKAPADAEINEIKGLIDIHPLMQ